MVAADGGIHYFGISYFDIITIVATQIYRLSVYAKHS